NLAGEVRSHKVYVVGEILPGACHTRHDGLATELAFGSDFAGHAAHLAGESIELVDHGVDGVLQRQNFAFDFDGDLAAQVTASDAGGHVGDVANLGSAVIGHRINVVR